MIPSNFRIEILSILALLYAIGSKGLKIQAAVLGTAPYPGYRRRGRICAAVNAFSKGGPKIEKGGFNFWLKMKGSGIFFARSIEWSIKNDAMFASASGSAEGKNSAKSCSKSGTCGCPPIYAE